MLRVTEKGVSPVIPARPGPLVLQGCADISQMMVGTTRGSDKNVF
jgi:hypothetical protein